jgi:hypothetical protein
MDFFERCFVVLTVVGSLGVIAVVIWMKVHSVTATPAPAQRLSMRRSGLTGSSQPSEAGLTSGLGVPADSN